MTTTRRPYAALAGLLATIAALGVGELAAGLISSWYSPVQAVGDTAIFYTPRLVKDAAIAAFGTNDKAALIMGTLLVTLAFGTLLGVLGGRRLPVAWAGIVLFGVIGVAASTFQDGLGASVPSVMTCLVGIPMLTWLLRTAPARDGDGQGIGDAPVAGAPAGAAPAVDTAAHAGDRRRFLTLSGGVVVGSLAAVAGGRTLVNRRREAIAEARTAIAEQIGQGPSPSMTAGDGLRPLGLVAQPLPPLPDGVDLGIEGLEAFQTPDGNFYRIDIALAVPQIDPDTWTLRIHGMVEEERVHTYEELLRRPDLIEADITMTCVSNEVGGHLMSSGRWTGIPLRTLLDEAGVKPGADQLVGWDGDGFSTGFPVAVLDDGREAMLALLLNGDPLSPERGFPARVVVPGLYGYVSATKWITEIELTTFADFDQYWVQRGWDAEAPIKAQSRIDVPRPLQRIPAGQIVVAGVAWAQRRGIGKVEIRVGEGPWEEVELAGELNTDTWRQWHWTWEVAEPGNYQLTVRTTDKAGEVQTEERRPPFPNGASGWNNLLVTVTA